MGYTTFFDGSVTITPPLNAAEIAVFQTIENDRQRDTTPHPAPAFPEVPGVWCGWTVTENGAAIHWNENEKFYHAAEWLNYLIKQFFVKGAPGRKMHKCMRLHTVNGEIIATGEEIGDHWLISVIDNEVTVQTGTLVYE